MNVPSICDIDPFLIVVFVALDRFRHGDHVDHDESHDGYNVLYMWNLQFGLADLGKEKDGERRTGRKQYISVRSRQTIILLTISATRGALYIVHCAHGEIVLYYSSHTAHTAHTVHMVRSSSILSHG